MGKNISLSVNWNVLEAIKNKKDDNGKLSKFFNIAQSTMSEKLKTISEKGLIIHSKNHRKIFLTDFGKEYLAEIKKILSNKEKQKIMELQIMLCHLQNETKKRENELKQKLIKNMLEYK